MMQELGLNTFPTLQFYRGRRLLHEIRGTDGAEKNLGEGVLFFGDGIKGKEVITEVKCREDLDAFLLSEPEECQLSVVHVRNSTILTIA